MRSYLDDKGWIGHVQKDGGGQLVLKDNGQYLLEFGDGVQRMSMSHLFDYFLAKDSMTKAAAKAGFWSKSRCIWLENGEPVRHWTKKEWYGQAGTFSGDQLEAYMWAAVAMRLPDVFWEMFKKVAKRGFFTWNTKKIGQTSEEKKLPDFVLHRLISPLLREISTMSLGFMIWPLVLVWDLTYGGLNSILRTSLPLFMREETTDDINYVVSLVGQKMVCPTPISFFFTMLYVGFRPLAKLHGDIFFNTSQKGLLGAQSAFNQYFNEEAAPPLNEKASWVILSL